MTPLIDGDILLHELGWSGQFINKRNEYFDPDVEEGEEIILPFDRVHDLLTQKIKVICEEVEATTPPIIFLTDDKNVAAKQGREFVPNFRYDVATTMPYKGTRKNPKPFHYYNLYYTLLCDYDTRIVCEGLEADDMLGIHQDDTSTIICSRDKDLRMVPGWHYSWECGNQASIGPVHTDNLGWLEYNGNKVLGYGKKFLFYQMIVGDSTDNIPGIKGKGEKFAYPLISNCTSIKQMYQTVFNLYNDKFNKDGWYMFKEQGDLLFIRHNEGEDFITYFRRLLNWDDE